MPLLLYRPDQETPKRRAKTRLDSCVLNPGRNHYSSEEYELLKRHPLFASWQEQGIIEVVSEKPSPPKPSASPILGLTVAEAVKLIESENSIEELESWRSAEVKGKNRASVINAISRQIQDIKSANL